MRPTPEPNQVPPLGVWIATAGLVLMLAAATTGVALWAEHRANRQLEAQTASLLHREWRLRADSVLSVVVLGTSMTQSGVQLSGFFQRQSDNRCRVVRVFRYGANLESFTSRSNVFRWLERYPPDLLLLEENLFFFTLEDQLAVQPDALAPRNVVQWLLRLAGLAPTRLPPFDALPPNHRQRYQTTRLRMRAFLAEIDQRPVRPFDPTHPVHGYLKALRQRGTRLGLLHLPRPARVEALIYNPMRGAQLHAVAAAYDRAYGMRHFYTDEAYAPVFFTDEAHLNEAGCRRYSTWLNGQLQPYYAALLSSR